MVRGRSTVLLMLEIPAIAPRSKNFTSSVMPGGVLPPTVVQFPADDQTFAVLAVAGPFQVVVPAETPKAVKATSPITENIRKRNKVRRLLWMLIFESIVWVRRELGDCVSV